MQQQFKAPLLLWTANSVVFSDRNCILEMNSEWVFGFLSESLGNDAKKETSLCNLSCPTENNAPTVSVWEEKIWPVSCSISPDLTRFYHPRRSFKYLERKLQETKSQTVRTRVWNLTWEVSPVLTLPVWSPDSMLETNSSCMIKENAWKRNEFLPQSEVMETERLCVCVCVSQDWVWSRWTSCGTAWWRTPSVTTTLCTGSSIRSAARTSTRWAWRPTNICSWRR